MDEKVIIAALEEMKIRSLRFNMDDLTKRLHMSKTSLYKIIGTKDNLIHEVIGYLIAKFEAKERKIKDDQTSMQEKISKFVYEYTQLFNFLERGVYDDLQLSYPDEWQRCENFRNQKLDTLSEFINDGMTQGEFRLIDSAVLQHCLLSTYALLSDEKFLNENDLTYSQAVESLRDLFFNGVLKR